MSMAEVSEIISGMASTIDLPVFNCLSYVTKSGRLAVDSVKLGG